MHTLKELSRKLNGKYWEKGDLKRIYLSKGHNTKKMSTKTFIWQNENGDFIVSCKIDCPSQSYNWISSQEDEVKESVMNDITNATSNIVYLIKNKEGNFVDFKTDACEINDCEVYFSKYDAKIDAEELHGDGVVFEMNREKFNLEIARLDKIEDLKPKLEDKKEVPKSVLRKKVEAKAETIDFEIGKTYNHSSFGNGILKSNDGKIGIIDFKKVGEKSLLMRFANLILVK